MKTIIRELDLSCSKERVWEVLTDPLLFQQWGSAFNETATFEGKMALNETIIFLDGEGMGMETTITQFVPCQRLRYSFINQIGGEAPVEDAIFRQQYEQYSLEQVGEDTHLTVELYAIDEYYEGMNVMWDEAVIKLKSLCVTSLTKNELKLLNMSFGDLYKLYLNKVQKKDRSKEELDELLIVFSGYTNESFPQSMNQTVESFLREGPSIQFSSLQVKGLICGIRVEAMKDGYMKQIRALDKVVDDLTKGQALEKIKRKYSF